MIQWAIRKLRLQELQSACTKTLGRYLVLVLEVVKWRDVIIFKVRAYQTEETERFSDNNWSKKQIQGVQRRPLRHRFAPWVGKIPWRSAWQPTPILLLRKSHRQTSLMGNSPWGCKETVFKTFWKGKDDLCFLQNEWVLLNTCMSQRLPKAVLLIHCISELASNISRYNWYKKDH